MNMRRRNVRSVAILATLAMVLVLPLSAQANHAWGTYHWAKSAAEVPITVVDSMTSNWDSNRVEAIGDWAGSSVLAITSETGNTSNKTRKRCPAVSGKVRVCNATYGYNGWLGLAQIWVSGGHIVQGVAKMNDSYLASGYGDTNRQHVICQEIGHNWGLGHQDESGADRNTCMDYSSALDNRAPNGHDYQQLETIYAGHTDTVAPPQRKKGKNRSEAAFANANVRAQTNWGRKVHGSANGKSAVFVRDFGGGLKIYTHVTWVR
jgi:hypothetical protein